MRRCRGILGEGSTPMRERSAKRAVADLAPAGPVIRLASPVAKGGSCSGRELLGVLGSRPSMICSSWRCRACRRRGLRLAALEEGERACGRRRRRRLDGTDLGGVAPVGAGALLDDQAAGDLLPSLRNAPWRGPAAERGAYCSVRPPGCRAKCCLITASPEGPRRGRRARSALDLAAS